MYICSQVYVIEFWQCHSHSGHSADCFTDQLIGLNEPSVTSRQRPDERRYGDGDQVNAVDKLTRGRVEVDGAVVDRASRTIVVGQHYCSSRVALTALQRAKYIHLMCIETRN